VRQTRGKFGLGAKMALIWAKKSSGMPIEVETAHTASEEERRGGTPPAFRTRCRLDIDIDRNEPRILLHERAPNEAPALVGTTLSVLIGGDWTA